MQKEHEWTIYLVKALHLQRGLGDGEVDHGHTGADVRRELDRRVAGREEDGEGRRQIDVLGEHSHKKLRVTKEVEHNNKNMFRLVFRL